MKNSFKRQIESFFRALMIAMLLVNTIGPAAANAQPLSKTNDPAPRTMPAAEPPIYYTPPQIPEKPAATPAPKKPGPKVPPHALPGAIDFAIAIEPGAAQLNDIVSLGVTLKNTSGGLESNLLYSDTLEAGLEFVPSADSPVSYDKATRRVSYAIASLGTDQTLSFAYKLKVVSTPQNGSIRVHSASLVVPPGNGQTIASQLSARAFLAVGSNLVTAQTHLAALGSADGWHKLGNVSVYIKPGTLNANSVLAAAPVTTQGRPARNRTGQAEPTLQFKFDVLASGAFSEDSQGQLGNQDVPLQGASSEPFKNPAFIQFNLQGQIDLNHIPAGQSVYVATYDETAQVWVKVPIVEIDKANNTVTVKAAHFSTWGAGIGASLPQNGANVLLFDQPYTSLFTGSAQYSIPIWMPKGRAGMAPSLSLSYSSGGYNGVLGDIQAPWVGAGWNIDGTEIVRQITTSDTGYGYVNSFALTINGTKYDLIEDTDTDPSHWGLYYTKQSSFLYIRRHNFALGNASVTSANGAVIATVPNTSGEWWEVVTTDGTRYRLGWNGDSEQMALMYGYACTVGNPCTAPNGSYASSGYAGKAMDLVALRWRVDQVMDTHGNTMTYTYKEYRPDAATQLPAFDRESYLSTINYTGTIDGEAPGYQVQFVPGNRSATGDNIPNTFNVWDNFDTHYLDEIVICYLAPGSGENRNCDDPDSTVVRTYDLHYYAEPVPNTNGTLVLDSLAITGGGFTDPESGVDIPETRSATIKFSYQNFRNTNDNNNYLYPRLVKIENGYGGSLTYTYGNDGRTTPNTWFNWRVATAIVRSDASTVASNHGYSYPNPAVYSDGTTALGELIGYPDVTDTTYDFSNAKILDVAHHFGTTAPDIGYELDTKSLDSSGTILNETGNSYVTDNSKAPYECLDSSSNCWNYRYLYQTDTFIRSAGALTLATRTRYHNDPATGNLLWREDFKGSALYRKEYYEYLINASPAVHILNKATRDVIVDASNAIFSDIRYHYDEDTSGITAPTKGELSLTQRVVTINGLPKTVDSTATYDKYGNLIGSCAYTDYGELNTPPTGSCQANTTTYDNTLHTYSTESENDLHYKSTVDYLFTLGLPYRSTDPNGWQSTTEYDGLGRTLSTTVPGLSDKGVMFTYPQPNVNGTVTAPYNIQMQILDTYPDPIHPVYRSVWGIYDGLGRIIQSQVKNDDDQQNPLLVSDTSFNPQGNVKQQSIPHTLPGTGGTYLTANFSKATVNNYDALGRVVQVTAPGNIISQTQYDGFTTTSIDPNNHKTIRINDALGRLIQVKETNGDGSTYATTNYSYDTANRLLQVIDAQNNVTTLQYDLLGRKTSMHDPDMGLWSYVYDSLGNLTSQTDARTCVTSFTYDSLNRLLGKSYTGPANYPACQNNIPVSYTYDNTTPGQVGMRIGMQDGSGSTSWSYTDYGRSVTETRTIGADATQTTTKSSTTTSDWLGRPLTVTYPGTDVVSYAYDALGQAKGMQSSAHANLTLAELAYNQMGQITNITLGKTTNPDQAAATIFNTYDTAGGTYRLSNRLACPGKASTPCPSSTLMNFSYSYDNAGNITQIVDNALNETHTYQYDSLDRLIFAKGVRNGGSAIYQQNYSYDKIGNILQVDNGTQLASILGGTTLASSNAGGQAASFSAAYQDPAGSLLAADNSPDRNSGNDSLVSFKHSGIQPPLRNPANVLPAGQDPRRAQDPGDTDTPTPSDTPTPTATETATETPTETPTLTLTETSTPTITATSTVTRTPSITKTITLTRTASPTPTAITFLPVKAWNFDTTSENWIVGNQVTGLAWQNGGYLGGTISGTDPFIYSSDNLNVDLSNTKLIKIRLKYITGTTMAQMFFTTTADGAFNEAKSKAFTVVANSDYAEYTLDMSTVAGWTGTLRRLRFDPATATGSFSIDYIRLGSDQPATPAANWLLDEADGTTQAYDATGLGHTGTLYKDILRSNAGRINRAVRFSDDSFGMAYVRIGSIDQSGVFTAAQNWNFDTTVEGWTATNIANFAWQGGGVVTGDITVTDPQTYSPLGVSVDLTNNKIIKIHLRNTNLDTTGMIYFTTVANTAWDGTKSKSFQAQSNADYTEYTIDMSSVPSWTGTLRQLRFDPPSGSANGPAYIQVPYVTGLESFAGLTVSAWVYPEQTINGTTYTILNKGGASQDYVLQVNSNGYLEFRMNDLTPAAVIGPRLPLKTWSHVVGMYSPGENQLKLYVNGVLTASKLVTAGAVSYDGSALYLGYPSNSWVGALDEVRVYGRAMLDSQVDTLFKSYPTPTPLPTVTPSYTPINSATPTITRTATPLPLSVSPWGDGRDGALVIPTATLTTFNINTDHSDTRTCADGVAYSVSSLGSTAATLSTVPATGCLKTDDEILLINLQDPTGTNYSVGNFEFLRVAQDVANTSIVTFQTQKTRFYGTSFQSDAGLGTGTYDQKVMLMRVPNYRNLTVNTGGTLTANAWDGLKYGVLAFRVSGTLMGSGLIHMDAKGYRGTTDFYKTCGEAHIGYACNSGSGSKGHEDTGSNPLGGGGAYGTNGESLDPEGVTGIGGVAYGDRPLYRMYPGSAGGAGGDNHRNNGEVEKGGIGGSGGGIVFFAGATVNFAGTVSSNGANGPLGGGPGAGGAVRIEGNTVNLGIVSALDGRANATGGNGRVAIYYQTSYGGSTSSPNAYDARLGQGPAPTAFPTTITYTTNIDPGTGADGDLNIASGTFNINSQTQNGARTCPGGSDAIAYSVIEVQMNYARVSTAPNPNCLKAGDEILLINLQGISTNYPNVGKYEFLRVGNVVGDRINFASLKKNFYGANASDDSNIGTWITQQKVMLMRVPNYNNVTINGTLTANVWDGYKYGVLAFRVKGTLSGTGTIHTNALGYRGDTLSSSCGETYLGFVCGYGGGSGASYSTGSNPPGGGGAYGSDGLDGYGYGVGGNAYGDATLGRLYYGSAGGQGGENHRNNGTKEPGGPGGKGGGIIFIAVNQINSFSGSVQSNGGSGSIGGGGGAGGSIRIEANQVNSASLVALGWQSPSTYGTGRIALYYNGIAPTYSSNPAAYTQNLSVTPTATLTPLPTATATLAAPANPANPGINKLVGYWSMDEAAGNRIDSYGANTLLPANAPGIMAGLKGNAVRFNTSAAQYMYIADNPSVSLNNTSFTISGWLRFSALPSTSQFLVNKWGAVGNQEYFIALDTAGKLNYLLSVDGTNYRGIVTAALSANTWHHFAAEYDGATMILYVDAGAPAGLAYSGVFDGTNSLVLGSWGTNITEGLDEVAIWKRALTASEVAWLYNSGAGHSFDEIAPNPGVTNLAAYWPLDETTGDRADAHGTTTLSPTNNPGTMAGVKGNALLLNSASAQYVAGSDNTGISLNNTPFTISGWTRFSALPSTNPIIINKWGGVGAYEYAITLSTTGQLWFGVSSNGTVYTGVGSAQILSPNTWYHFAAVYDGTKLALYINAGIPTTLSYNAGIFDGNNPFVLGTWGSNISQAIDEVSIYKRALSPAEIAWLYNNGAGRSYNEIAPNPGTANLAAYWSMDETNGTRFDALGNASLSSVVNIPGSTAGLQGNALMVNSSTSQYVGLADNPSISLNGTAFTISGWTRFSAMPSANQIMVNKWGAAGAYEYFLILDTNGKMNFVVSSNGTAYTGVVSTQTLLPNNWYHIAAVYDGMKLALYINAGLPTTLGYSAGVFDGNSPIIFGTWGTNVNLMTDEVSIYKRALSPGEITWLYNSGRGRNFMDINPNPNFTWWSLDEANGTRRDSDGNNALSDNNTVTSTSGKKSNAGLFTAANTEYLSMASNASVNVGAGARTTICTWVKLNSKSASATQNFIVNRGAADGSYAYWLRYDNAVDRFAFIVSANGYAATDVQVNADVLGSPAVGTWYYLCAGYDGTALWISVNGDTRSTIAYSSGIFAPVDATFFVGGGYGGGWPLDGALDEIVIYKRSLSPTEVAWHYNSGAGRSASEIQPSTPKKLAYTYSTTHPHAVASVADLNHPTATPNSYVYDDNGNMKQRIVDGVTYTMDYNAENRIASIHWGNNNESFFYDGNGTRVATLTDNGSGPVLSAYFMGGAYEATVTSDGTQTAWRKYYAFGGVSMMDGGTGADGSASAGLKYFLSDQLGSNIATLDANGALIAQQRYLPFGQVRGDVTSPNPQYTDFGYTGQRNLNNSALISGQDLGLMDYKARFYDPSIGRFLQPDLIVSNPSNSQTWNRYSYVSNNPIRFADPSGHSECDYIPGGSGSAHDACSISIGEPVQSNKLTINSRGEIVSSSGTRDGRDSGKGDQDNPNNPPPEKADPSLLIQPMQGYICPSGYTYAQCAYVGAYYDLGYSCTLLDSDQFNQMILAIYYDLKNRAPVGGYDFPTRSVYDTPFWNAYGQLPGELCVTGDKCYGRSEVNYVAQGMFVAAAHQDMPEAKAGVFGWKAFSLAKGIKDNYYDRNPNAVPAGTYWPPIPSQGTMIWFEKGYNYYNELDK